MLCRNLNITQAAVQRTITIHRRAATEPIHCLGYISTGIGQVTARLAKLGSVPLAELLPLI